MDVRVYILEEAALVTLTVPADASGVCGLLEQSLSGYRLHAVSNGLYDYLALRG